MKSEKEFVGFGAPSAFGAHIFRVEIPDGRNHDVIIVEDYGYKGAEDGIPKEEERIHINRSTWNRISSVAKKEFNERLKAAKLKGGQWNASGETLMDRLLGKELCILAWATESADKDEIDGMCVKWSALRPEERWWLFSMTVAESGLPEDSGKGWRKALYHALAPSEKIRGARKRRRPKESDMYMLPLFQTKELQ